MTVNIHADGPGKKYYDVGDSTAYLSYHSSANIPANIPMFGIDPTHAQIQTVDSDYDKNYRFPC